MMSRHFRLNSEPSGAIAKILPHAKNQLPQPGSFFNQFVTDIYIHICVYVYSSIYVHTYIHKHESSFNSKDYLDSYLTGVTFYEFREFLMSVEIHL